MKKHRLNSSASIISIVTIVLALLALMSLAPHQAQAEESRLAARHLVERAVQALETFAGAEEMEGFRSLIKNAEGVFIAPQILKGAFVVGASGGSGVFVARNSLTGQWVGPAFYTIGGASFGFQIGGSASEVILLAMTTRGVNALLESSIKLGGDVGVAVGPIGMGASASTANLSVDIVSFARSKGLYGGISLDGAVVKTRSDWNNAYYNGITTPADIILKRTAKEPHAAKLLETVTKLAKP